MEYPVVLGEKYKDNITGFTGVATAECQYLNGTASILLEVKGGEDGKLVSQWIDAQRLELIEPWGGEPKQDKVAEEGTGKAPDTYDPSETASREHV